MRPDRTRLLRTTSYWDNFACNYGVHPSGEQFEWVGGTGGTIVWRTGGLESEL